LSSSLSRSAVYLLAALALALVGRLLLSLFLGPATDVYYFDTEAVRVLLLGQNPYTHTFTSAPAQLMTPGGGSGFAYLPFTFAYLVPFYLLGDVRVGFVLADLVIGAAIARMSGPRSLPCALVYLFAPFTLLFSTVYLNDSLVAMCFIGPSFLAETKGRHRLSSVSYGLALASNQLAWLLLPFILLYHIRKRQVRYAFVSLAVAAAAIVPFFLASPTAFVQDILSFQFARSVLPLVGVNGPLGLNLNPSLAGTTFSLLGFVVPTYLRIALDGVILGALLLRQKRPETMLLPAAVFVLASVFLLPNDFFWAYAELPFMLFLLWLSRPVSSEL
jgi:hypothetical protein